MRKYKMNKLYLVAAIMLICALLCIASAVVFGFMLRKNILTEISGVAGVCFAVAGIIFALKSKPREEAEEPVEEELLSESEPDYESPEDGFNFEPEDEFDFIDTDIR